MKYQISHNVQSFLDGVIPEMPAGAEPIITAELRG